MNTSMTDALTRLRDAPPSTLAPATLGTGNRMMPIGSPLPVEAFINLIGYGEQTAASPRKTEDQMPGVVSCTCNERQPARRRRSLPSSEEHENWQFITSGCKITQLESARKAIGK